MHNVIEEFRTSGAYGYRDLAINGVVIIAGFLVKFQAFCVPSAQCAHL